MCQNANLARELTQLVARAKRMGVYKVGRKNGLRKSGRNKVSLKHLVQSLVPEMPDVDVYRKLIVDARKGKDAKGDGWYTRELFRTMKDLDYGAINTWHKMFDGYSPEDDHVRDQFRAFIKTDPIMMRVLM